MAFDRPRLDDTEQRLLFKWASLMPYVASVVQTPALTAPVNITVPMISGSPVVGGALTATPGTWTGLPTSYTYQWYAAGVAIGGATASSFTLTLAQVGEHVFVEVVAINSVGSSIPSDSAQTAVVTLPYSDAYDDVESYTVGNLLSGLSGGTGWSGAYVSRDSMVLDDMESYTVTANLNGLNGSMVQGNGWGGPYVDR